MIDSSLIGMETTESAIAIEQGMIRQFAASIAETNPIYFDVAAARAAGHPNILAPPTFGFSINNLHPHPFDFGKLGLKVDRVLHAEQKFVYFAPIYAGDSIRVHGRITDVFEKRGGLLGFVCMSTVGKNQHDRAVFEMVTVIVCRKEP
jgi:acyl dehydratase